jgi:hypothetical protein
VAGRSTGPAGNLPRAGDESADRHRDGRCAVGRNRPSRRQPHQGGQWLADQALRLGEGDVGQLGVEVRLRLR